jgi:hypothetical protein
VNFISNAVNAEGTSRAIPYHRGDPRGTMGEAVSTEADKRRPRILRAGIGRK